MSLASAIEPLEQRIAPAATFTWDGGGADSFWTTAANWVGDIAPGPGAALVFPENAARQANTNDFPARTAFDSLMFPGGSATGLYFLDGNEIVLANGIHTGTHAEFIRLPVALGADQTFTNLASDNPSPSLSGTLDLNGHTLTLDGAGGFDLSNIADTSAAGGGSILHRGEGFLGIGGVPDAVQIVNESGEITIASGPGADVFLNGGHLFRFLSIGALTANAGIIDELTGATMSGDLRLEAGVLLKHLISPLFFDILSPRIVSVAGTVTLNEPAFDLVVTSQPVNGSEIILIQNDETDSVAGHFAGLPEGTLFTPASNPFSVSAQFRITYAGGDGNDVALRVTVPEADVSADGKMATFTDVDGDNVTIRTTRGTLDPRMIILSPANSRGGHQLHVLDLDALFTRFDLAKVSITAERGPDGNGRVNVGEIRAQSNLTKLRVDGDVASVYGFDIERVAVHSVGVHAKQTLLEESTAQVGVGVNEMLTMRVAADIRGAVGTGHLNHLVVGGTLFGSVRVGRIQTIEIHGDIHGGFILVGEDEFGPRPSNLPSLHVGGSLIGGTGRHSGSVLVPNGTIEHLEIDGSIRASASGDPYYRSSILAGTRIENIEIHGDIVGTAATPVTIAANGATLYETPKAIDVAISRIAVDGDVRFTRFIAGRAFTNIYPGIFNADASIERIVVNGDWIASSAIAGVMAGRDRLIGTADDAPIVQPSFAPFRDDPQHMSHIGLIRIGGMANGSGAGGDSFGIVAQQIHVVQIGERIYLPSSSASDGEEFFYVGSTGPGPDGAPSDFTIHEVR
jgi:hypothetical protein